MGDGGGGRYLDEMEWCPDGSSVSASVIPSCTIKFRGIFLLLASAYLISPGKKDIKCLCVKWLCRVKDNNSSN